MQDVVDATQAVLDRSPLIADKDRHGYREVGVLILLNFPKRSVCMREKGGLTSLRSTLAAAPVFDSSQ